MPAQTLKQFLDTHAIKYVVINHSLAFTSLEIAKSSHIPSKKLAKTVIVKVADKFAMVVLPAAYQVDFAYLRDALGGVQVELANEHEFSPSFPDCEVGAMPPFGNLYGVEVFVDEALTEHEYIWFSSGSHSEIIKMRYKDYEDLVKPSLIILK